MDGGRGCSQAGYIAVELASDQKPGDPSHFQTTTVAKASESKASGNEVIFTNGTH